MTSEEKKATLQKALAEATASEYVAWVNWQLANGQVEKIVKLISVLEGS